MKVKEIYKISEVVHRAAGGKIENIFLFLNTVFWALLALIVGAAGFSLATGSVIVLYCRIYWNDHRIFWWKLLFI